MELSYAEAVGRAACFLGARGGQFRSGWDMCEVANAFGTVGRDHEMGLASFAGKARQQRADDAFVVGVSEYGDDEAAGLSRSRNRETQGQRNGG